MKSYFSYFLAAIIASTGSLADVPIAAPAYAQAQQAGPITLCQSTLFSAPNNQVQQFRESIQLAKGQDKLTLVLTYYNGTSNKPGFQWLRISSPTMSYFTEKQFDGNKSVSIDVTGQLSSGGNQITVEGAGPVGATFGWRLTTTPPIMTEIHPAILDPGETITISGKNFSADPTCNIATVNGVALNCISATSKNLVFKVPDDMRMGRADLQLKVAGLDAGQMPVAVEHSAPVLQSLGAGWVCPGTNLVINGGPFPSVTRLVRVTIGPFEAPVVATSVNSITVQAPEQFMGNPWGVNQPVKVWVNGMAAKNFLTVNCYQGISGTTSY